jgi:hypothetical protein
VPVDVEDRHRDRGQSRHALAAAQRVALATEARELAIERRAVEGRLARGGDLQHLLELVGAHVGHDDAAARAQQHRLVLALARHRHQRRRRVDDLEHHPLGADRGVQRDRLLRELVDLEHHRPRDLADAQRAAHHAREPHQLQRQAVLLVVHADQEARALERVDQPERGGLGHPDALGDLLQRQAQVRVVECVEDGERTTDGADHDGDSEAGWGAPKDTSAASRDSAPKRCRCALALPSQPDSTIARFRYSPASYSSV